MFALPSARAVPKKKRRQDVRDNEPHFRVPGDVSKSEVEVISMFSEVFHACAMKRRGDTRRIHAMEYNIFILGPDFLVNTFQNGTLPQKGSCDNAYLFICTQIITFTPFRQNKGQLLEIGRV